MNKHVLVLGGGVGGLSAAHELIDRKFDVTVLERAPGPGGKASSFGVRGTGREGRRDLPGEHGFRFLPGFYRHIPDTMCRIPFGRKGSVFDNLIDAVETQIVFSGGRKEVLVPSRFPRSASELRKVLQAARCVIEEIGLTPDEIELYCDRLWQLLTSCEERRSIDLEGVSWWEYIKADGKSDAYRDYLGKSPQVLVAADPENANAKTVGEILLQLLFNLVQPGMSADRVLNGPTNDVWIDPWRAHLESKGVNFVFGAEVLAFDCDGGRIGGVTFAHKGEKLRKRADYYVAALPVECMAAVLNASPDVQHAAPDLAAIPELAGHVGWMNGIQYYLLGEPALAFGHQMFLGSSAALTSISQAQFWFDDDTGFSRAYGDGSVHTVLSVDVSDWCEFRARKWKNPARARDAIARRVWQQLRAGLPSLSRASLHKETPWMVDPAIQCDANGMLTNAAPLLVNRICTWDKRPWAKTQIGNLFLAADYVRTYTNLATMEAANEAARWAVNGIIDASNSKAPYCKIWQLHEPAWIRPWRAWDLFKLRNGEAWNPEMPLFVGAASTVLLGTAPSVGTDETYADFERRETIRGGVASVPSYVERALVQRMLDLRSAVRGKKVEEIGSFFAAAIEVNMLRGLFEPKDGRADGGAGALGTMRVANTEVSTRLEDFFKEEEGTMDLDIQRLKSLRVKDNAVVAAFELGLTVFKPKEQVFHVNGTYALTFTQEPGPRADQKGLWLIAGLQQG